MKHLTFKIALKNIHVKQLTSFGQKFHTVQGNISRYLRRYERDCPLKGDGPIIPLRACSHAITCNAIKKRDTTRKIKTQKRSMFVHVNLLKERRKFHITHEKNCIYLSQVRIFQWQSRFVARKNVHHMSYTKRHFNTVY